MATVSSNVSVSKTIPPEISFPDPLLVAAAGTWFDGLSPTALSVPAGERSNWTMAACDESPAVRRSRASVVFIGSPKFEFPVRQKESLREQSGRQDPFGAKGLRLD